MSVKVEIGMTSLRDIIEKAYKLYTRKLADAEDMYGAKFLMDILDDVIRLWEALYDNFDCDDELILTIERREEEKDGSDNRN